MLKSNEYGYAVMQRDLSAFCFESISKEDCVDVCKRNAEDYIVVRKIPKVCGFNLTFTWLPSYDKFFEFVNKNGNKRIQIGRLWIQSSKEYIHVNGEVVYDPKLEN